MFKFLVQVFFLVLFLSAETSVSVTIDGKSAASLSDIQTSISSYPVLKTGTTIVGVCCRDGVVLGADTRTTGGSIVMNKNKLKITCIAPRIYCCAAGTSADCDQVTRKTGLQLARLRIERELSGERGPILDSLKTAAHCLSLLITSPTPARRMPHTVIIMGGVDSAGPALFQIDQSGVPQRARFAALGSGSTDAIAVLEAIRSKDWKPHHILPQCKTDSTDSNATKGSNATNKSNTTNESNARENISASIDSSSVTVDGEGDKADQSQVPPSLLHWEGSEADEFTESVSVEEAIVAVRRAVRAGILNDLGSGSHVDIVVIRQEGVQSWRESLTTAWQQRQDGGSNPVPTSTFEREEPVVSEDESSPVSDVTSKLGRRVFSRPLPLRADQWLGPLRQIRDGDDNDDPAVDEQQPDVELI